MWSYTSEYYAGYTLNQKQKQQPHTTTNAILTDSKTRLVAIVITTLLSVAYDICRNGIAVDYDDNTDDKYKIDY